MRRALRRHGGPFGYQWDLPAYLVFFAGLLALSCIDIERMILPKKIVYPLTVLVAALLLMAAAATGKWHELCDRCHLRRRLVRRVLRDEPREPRVLASGTSGSPWSSAWRWGGWASATSCLGFFAANLIGAVIGLTLIATKHMRRAGSPTACSWLGVCGGGVRRTGAPAPLHPLSI